MRKNVVILTGAGISAESGLSTFRDQNGLWEGHEVTAVASPEGWHKDQELVLDFYNQRRAQLLEVTPNQAHLILAEMEQDHDVEIITQNVDDLHERAGSQKVLHLHGELFKVRSTGNEQLVYTWQKDLLTGDICEEGHQLRPHIVWFGEAVPMLEPAIALVRACDTLVIIGTSLQVYPAASLIAYAPRAAKIIYIDPKPFISQELATREHEVIAEKATLGTVGLSEKV